MTQRFTLRMMDYASFDYTPVKMQITIHVHDHGAFTGIADWIEVVKPDTNDHNELVTFAKAQVKALESELHTQGYTDDEDIEEWLKARRKASRALWE